MEIGWNSRPPINFNSVKLIPWDEEFSYNPDLPQLTCAWSNQHMFKNFTGASIPASFRHIPKLSSLTL